MRPLFRSRNLSLFLALGLGLGGLTAGAAGRAEANPSMLFDLATGEVLAHEEAFRRWHPASLTKLMTAYVVFRALNAGEVTLQSPIRMTRHAAKMPPAKMGFKPGSVLTLDNALKSIMVKSANDVAMAIGENIGGSEKEFAARMNAEAQRLGMTGSHWVNPNGLHAPDQYTTAHDLALLVRAIRTEYPQYQPYFSIDGIVVGKTVLKTFNTLMGRYAGADGMKTGFICPSGFNLIGTASRDGRTLAAIVLGEESPAKRAEHAAALLDAGFAPAPLKPALAAAKAPTPAPAAPQPVTLATLQPYGEGGEAVTDFSGTVCKPPPKTKPAEAAPPSEAGPEKVEDTMLPNYQARLEVVTLGGATGPVPKGMLDAAGGMKEDVPLPTWRPDLPPPPGGEPVAQTSAPAAVRAAAKPAPSLVQGDRGGIGGGEAGGIEAQTPPAAPLGFTEPAKERFGGPMPLRSMNAPS